MGHRIPRQFPSQDVFTLPTRVDCQAITRSSSDGEHKPYGGGLVLQLVRPIFTVDLPDGWVTLPNGRMAGAPQLWQES